MAVEERSAFGRRLESATERYLDRIGDCVSALPPLVEGYETGTEYRQVVSRIQYFESACDELKLELGKLLTSADSADVGLRLTWIDLHADRMLGLYDHLDTIANTSEQFAEELAAISPERRTDCLDGLVTMAKLAAAAMIELERVVVEFVRSLCRPAYATSISSGVSKIRALEGESDAVRNRVLEAAFDGEHDGDALVYRQFAVLLDGVLDAMEDVTDQMHLIAGSEGWFEIQVYPEYGY